jgi:hypothetical protein
MRWIMVAVLALQSSAADLDAIRREANPDRRGQLALDHAGASLDVARTAYEAGDSAKTEAALQDVSDSVDLAVQSVQIKGSMKMLKRAEMATRQLLRRIEGMAETVGYEERPLVEKLRDHVSGAHDQLLQGIMAKK